LEIFSPKPLAGEWLTQANELPWGDEIVISFGKDKLKKKRGY